MWYSVHSIFAAMTAYFLDVASVILSLSTGKISSYVKLALLASGIYTDIRLIIGLLCSVFRYQYQSQSSDSYFRISIYLSSYTELYTALQWIIRISPSHGDLLPHIPTPSFPSGTHLSLPSLRQLSSDRYSVVLP